MTLLIDPPQTSSAGSAREQRFGERELIDSFGRRISDMRISVTDRCNFRCVYCMPEEGMQWLKRETLLTFDEIERLTRIAVDLGIEEVRLTGGEPTLRPDLPRLVERLSRMELRSLSLTTNGFLLQRMARPLAEAGLTRINVSLDTLQHDRFHQVARRRGLDEVLAERADRDDPVVGGRVVHGVGAQAPVTGRRDEHHVLGQRVGDGRPLGGAAT